MINSRYWPGSIESISYLFDEDLFALWDSYRLHMPGSSENCFIESLVDISLQNNRVSPIKRFVVTCFLFYDQVDHS